MDQIRPGRRAFTQAAGAALLSAALPGRAQSPGRPVLADIHSHAGMFSGARAVPDLRAQMVESGTMLVSWAIVDDAGWTRSGPSGIKQVREPAAGELWDSFQARVRRYDAALRGWNLPKVLAPADIDAALAGEPRVVMASESANFLEGRLERVALAHAMGLRHLQLVHFIQSPLGDLQTEPPRHQGMPPLALQVMFSDYTALREVAEVLVRRGLPEVALRDVCCGNYARVLKQAMAV
jgi:membrane dipeptidase